MIIIRQKFDKEYSTQFKKEVEYLKFTKNVDLQKLIGSCKDTITSYVKRAKLCGLINNA